eukprot:scaffold27711_cov124-Isochrysis_galbana.AAC.2
MHRLPCPFVALLPRSSLPAPTPDLRSLSSSSHRLLSPLNLCLARLRRRAATPDRAGRRDGAGAGWRAAWGRHDHANKPSTPSPQPVPCAKAERTSLPGAAAHARTLHKGWRGKAKRYQSSTW